MDQEILQRAMQLRQESEYAEQQLQFVVQQIGELQDFEKGLEFLERSKEKEILAPLGKGVYVKADRKEEGKIFVEVGAGIVLKKTPAEARETIKGQIKRFQEARIQLNHQLHEHALEFQKMLAQVEAMKKE